MLDELADGRSYRPTLNGLIRGWRELVEQIESGYDWSFGRRWSRARGTSRPDRTNPAGSTSTLRRSRPRTARSSRRGRSGVSARDRLLIPRAVWIAQEGGWIKSLLLFFDEIAILLPSYMRGRNLLADPTLAAPLADEGLPRVLEPESFLDAAGAERLVEVVTALVIDGAFDELADAAPFAEISMSRMGYGVLHEVSHALYDAR